MKITKNELKKIINESVEKQLRKTKFNQHSKLVGHRQNKYNKKVNENSNNEYKYFPKNKRELKQLITDEIKFKGNDCSLNMINTSKIKDMSRLFFKSNFNGNVSD